MHVPSLGPLAFMPSLTCLTFIAVTTGTFQSLLGLQQGASLLPIPTILPCSRAV